MKIAVCSAALAVGIVLASVPAFAQSMQRSDFSGTTRNANDGGMVGLATGSSAGPAAPARQSRQYYNYAPATPAISTSTTARGANDGGMLR